MTAQPSSRDDATAFREAIAQWQLAARTEVKRSSSLPSSMFDASDPMLEARLAESVEAMMQCLHQPDLVAVPEQAALKPSDMRVETIASDELQRLPRLVPTEDEALDLKSGITAEYLSLLVDTCTTGDDTTQKAARALLQRDFAVQADTNLEHTTTALLECIQRISSERAPNNTDGSHVDDHERLVELCGAIAASVILETEQGFNTLQERKSS